MRALLFAVFAAILADALTIPTSTSKPTTAKEITIEDMCPKTCQCSGSIQILSISHCAKPLYIDSSILVNATTVVALNFNNVTIERIEKDSFTKLRELENMMFKKAVINYMDKEMLGSVLLTTLKFVNCHFKHPPHLVSLELDELIISECNLREVPPLDNLTMLTLLSLDNNQIEKISSSQFENSLELEEVNLSNNNISHWPDDLFKNNTDISTLSLDNNPLGRFDLKATTNLEMLSLRNCKLTSLEHIRSANFDVLSSLDLSHNDIKEISSKTFKDMKNLMYINLSYNKLKILPEDIFTHNDRLEKIILDGNQLETLPIFQSRTSAFMTYLLSCNYCGIKHLPHGAFEPMTGLLDIFLSHNNLENVDNLFTKNSRLQTIDLSYNKIKHIKPTAFETNKPLVNINLSGNPLRMLDPLVFEKLRNLGKLYANATQLTQLWSNYEVQLNSIEYLYIANNNITVITADDLDIIPNLKYITLDNNPLKCNADLSDAIKWLTRKQVYTNEGEEVLKTHEYMLSTNVATFEETHNPLQSWQSLAKKACNGTDTKLPVIEQDIMWKETEEIEVKDPKDEVPLIIHDIEPKLEYENGDVKIEFPHIFKNSAKPDYSDEDMEDEDDYDADTEPSTDDKAVPKYINNPNTDFSSQLESKTMTERISDILTLSMAFIVTALFVLTIGVAAFLCILRKNSGNSNLPHIRIPWDNSLTLKKHSGSIYRPLSEDKSALSTPKFSRYEFSSTPTVHS